MDSLHAKKANLATLMLQQNITDSSTFYYRHQDVHFSSVMEGYFAKKMEIVQALFFIQS